MSQAEQLSRWWAPRFVLALVVVAVAAAGFAIAFRATLAGVMLGVADAATPVDAMTRARWGWRLVLPGMGGFIAGLILMRIRSRAGADSDVMEAVALEPTPLSLPVTAIKSLASWMAIVFGGSLGREGPLIEFGGAAGGAIATRIRLAASELRVLIAAGTAAGFAAAYNTPLAAIAFVIDSSPYSLLGSAMIHAPLGGPRRGGNPCRGTHTGKAGAIDIVSGTAATETIVPTLVATAIATALTRAFVGAGPIYGEHSFAVTSVGELAGFVCVGLICGLVAVAFSALVAVSETVFRRQWLRAPWRSAIGGLGAGAIIVVIPTVAGNGYEPLNDILSGASPVGMVAVLLVAKCIATSLSVGSGSPGGVFTPTLLIGGCTGFLVGNALGAIGFDVGPPGGYALVGMAAAIAAARQAPFMATVLAFELSGDYAVVLPLVLATAFAAALGRGLRGRRHP